MLIKDLAQVDGGIVTRRIGPHPDVLDDGGVLRLAQIRRPGQQRETPARGQHQALKKAEAEGVESREVEHALLTEHQQRVQAPRIHRGQRRIPPRIELFPSEMNRHGGGALFLLQCQRSQCRTAREPRDSPNPCRRQTSGRAEIVPENQRIWRQKARKTLEKASLFLRQDPRPEWRSAAAAPVLDTGAVRH